MSKHPTNELSPRDIACIEYGKALRHLRDEYVARHYTYEYEYVEELIAKCRAARERIFLFCFECRHCDIEAAECCKPGEEPRELTWQYEEACTCPHYKERMDANG